MTLRGDLQFVDGELRVARKKLSLLGTSTDAEFSINKNWKDLGGTGRIVVSEFMTDEAPCDGIVFKFVTEPLGPWICVGRVGVFHADKCMECQVNLMLVMLGKNSLSKTLIWALRQRGGSCVFAHGG